MQKKLIALAVAGLVSVPAFAQSNVTIYGIVDMGYVYRGDNVADGIKSRSGIDSGVANGSRIGFKGTEDLGNGLKAGFVLEQGILADTGSSAQGGKTFGRQSFVSLSGGFGTVALGRQYAPGYLLLDSVDPFSTGTVGQSNNVYLGEVRLNNLVAYVSPSWGGFNVTAGYTFNALDNEQSPRVSGFETDVRAWAISPKYVNGPLMVGLNLHEIKDKGSDDKVRVYDLGGSYNFGVAKVGAIFGLRRADGIDFGQFAAGEDTKQWMLGVTVPVGASSNVLASYGQRKTDIAGSSKDAKVSQWALGYEHWLSKRTGVYATYADINNNKAAEESGDGALIGSVGDATSAGDGYQRGFNVGVRHLF